MPLDAAHVWGWYVDLNAARSSGASANPISFTEIDAFARLHRISMEGWEVALLRRLDGLALSMDREKGKPRSATQEPAEKPLATPAEVDLRKAQLRSAFTDRRVVKRAPRQSPQE